MPMDRDEKPVLICPGQTSSTFTLYFFNSSRSELENILTEDLLAQYAPMHGIQILPATEEILAMVP